MANETKYILTSTKSGKKEFVAMPSNDIVPHTHEWTAIENKPTTLSGFGLATEVNNAVTAGIAAVVDSSPSTLDTLNELAAALGDDPNFATTVTNLIAAKAPIANPALTGYATITANDPYFSLTTNSAGSLVSPRNRKLLWRNYAGDEAGSVNLLDYNQDVLGTTMVFSVRNNAGTIIEAMRIIQNGNTAIGMTPGTEKFEVNGSIKGTSLKTTNFSFEESGTDLLIKYGSTIIATISSAGYIKAKNELEPFADI